MCLPGATINIPTITKTDENDAINFGLKHKVNFIAVSFARFGKDIEYLRKLLHEKDP
jgi:pyruvate kinase